MNRFKGESLKLRVIKIQMFLFAMSYLLLAVRLVNAKTPAKSSALPGVPEKEQATETPKKQPTVPQGQLPEVIIKGGEKTGVASEKPLLDVQVNPDEAVLPTMEVEDEFLKRQPETLRNPRAGFAESLANSRTILPARIRLARDPVKIFYPLREIMATSPSLVQEIGTGWELVITDTEGHPFRKFSGGGLPPGNISWNGRSEKGEIIGAGKTYSIVINYKDIRGQARNFVGDSFSFDGVIHQESKGLTISLAFPSLFEAKKGFAESETIGDSGLGLLQEVADWIKRYYFTYPVRVECYSSDDSLSLSRSQAVAKILASILLLPRGELSANGTVADLSKERVDIVIGNR